MNLAQNKKKANSNKIKRKGVCVCLLERSLSRFSVSYQGRRQRLPSLFYHYLFFLRTPSLAEYRGRFRRFSRGVRAVPAPLERLIIPLHGSPSIVVSSSPGARTLRKLANHLPRTYTDVRHSFPKFAPIRNPLPPPPPEIMRAKKKRHETPSHKRSFRFQQPPARNVREKDSPPCPTRCLKIQGKPSPSQSRVESKPSQTKVGRGTSRNQG